MDEEWARRVIAAQAAGEDVASAANPDKVSPLGYTPEVAYLALIADRVELVRNAIFATNAEDGKAPPFEPLPRPETAMDRVRERFAHDELMDLDRLIRGGAD